MDKNFLHIDDLNETEFKEIIQNAKNVKSKFKNNEDFFPLANSIRNVFAKFVFRSI